ncbi:MAG: hypothetical protein ABJO01_14355 [Parasphingorhabdus sp.]|uniref:hypothetical protein n=1 Tax=Parasphingorhabdus sp. TaxID=2709688 RepID=UPI00329A5534
MEPVPPEFDDCLFMAIGSNRQLACDLDHREAKNCLGILVGGRLFRLAIGRSKAEIGDVHKEYGGPVAAMILINLGAFDGRLADFSGPDGDMLKIFTRTNMIRSLIAWHVA